MNIETTVKKILLVLAIAIGSHILVLVIKFIYRKILRKKKEVENAKWLSISSLVVSILVFTIYFISIGKILVELGVSLSTYIASASIIGLAVAFGSQGIVQDIVTGVTVVFSDLIDIGDLIEIGGQTGYVEEIGMRFIVIRNVNKAQVFIPNRTINNVINYTNGNIKYYLDIRFPEKPENKEEILELIKKMIRRFEEQYPSFFIGKTNVTEKHLAKSNKDIIRIVFKMWPFRYSNVETNFKQELIQRLKLIDAEYAEWMISNANEIE
jgi:small conductance mechanosensitive channel